jgi:hypothetical protein
MPTKRNNGGSNIMSLDEAQRKKVVGWIEQGHKLSQIQTLLDSECGVKLTYMETRLLVDDLKLTPKDPEPPKAPVLPPAPAAEPVPPAQSPLEAPASEPAATPAAGVSVVLDKIAKPGSVVSGNVTFSDGQKATWYLDQTGRLGLGPELAGYRPSATDVQHFQVALDAELSKMGF